MNDYHFFKNRGQLMKETYSKNYFEKYAALTLTKVLDVSADNIIDVYKRQPLIESGPETVRQATFITIGNRVPD